MRAGETSTKILRPGGGGYLRVVDHPMANGGWVATFEDITEQMQVEQERDRNREFLDQIIENVPVTIIVKDAATRKFVLANRAAEILWSFDRREAIGKTPHDLFGKAQADAMTEADSKVLDADGPLFFGAHRTLSGVETGRIITSKRLCIRGPEHEPKYIVTVIEDVTERHEIEKERDRNREFLDQIIENVPSIIFVKNAGDRRYVLVNKAAENFWGVSRANMLGKTAHDVFSKAEADRITAREDELLEFNEPVFDEREIDAASGGLRSVFSRRLTIHDGEGKPQYLLAVIEDVTERKRAEPQIAHMAHSRRADRPAQPRAVPRAARAGARRVRRGGQLAVLYLDLDHFKSVNDTLGHPVGDELLKAVADRLRGCVRETDTVARLGGDEFAIIQTGIEQPATPPMLARTHSRGDHQAPLRSRRPSASWSTLSIGIALAPDDGADADQLLKNADLALYGAKADGRGTYRFFEPEMDARMKARRELELDLRKALGNGEFELHYQPLVNLDATTRSAASRRCCAGTIPSAA